MTNLIRWLSKKNNYSSGSYIFAHHDIKIKMHSNTL